VEFLKDKIKTHYFTTTIMKTFTPILLIFASILIFSCGESSQTEVATQKSTNNEGTIQRKPKQTTPEYTDCTTVLIKIVSTTNRYKEITDGLHDAIVQNGGSGFGIRLEGSPTPISDASINYSDTYDFNVHESYPDRHTVIARFSFDPVTEHLYEYDVVNDAMKQIDFNRDLLTAYKELCK
jgi:hypothetical protein